MNIVLKYIIFFLLGLITYLFINKTKTIEGFNWQQAGLSETNTGTEPFSEPFYFNIRLDIPRNLNGINTIAIIDDKLLTYLTASPTTLLKTPLQLKILGKIRRESAELPDSFYYFENISNNYINNYYKIY